MGTRGYEWDNNNDSEVVREYSRTLGVAVRYIIF